MPIGDAPVAETIAELTAISLTRCELDAGTHILVRLAALAAVDAPAASYLLHIDPAVASGVTVEDAQDVLIAIAPIIGTARTASAAAKIGEALGVAIALALDEAEAEAEEAAAIGDGSV